MKPLRTILIATLILMVAARDASPEPAPLPAPGRVPHLKLPGERTLCKPAPSIDNGDGSSTYEDVPPSMLGAWIDSEFKWCRTLPPGRFLDEPEWAKLDAAIVDRDRTIARLKAENDTYKNAADSWSPGWKTLVGAVGLGISIGVYAATR